MLLTDVKGKTILINEAKLANILGIAAPGSDYFCFTDHHNSLSDSFYGKATVYKTITREDDFIGQEIRVSNMNASDTLLLNVISHIIFNKSARVLC